MRVLLVGVGSPFRGDDAVGLVVARAAGLEVPSGIEVVEVADPSALVDLWDGVDHAVVVDATVSGQPAGTVTTLDVAEAPLPTTGWASGGTHALGLAAAVELARTLGRLPPRLHVVGVEVADTSPGETLSPSVAAAVPAAVAAALAALASLP